MSADVASRIGAVAFWFHSIDVGEGVVTPGQKSASTLQRELDSLALPPLVDKTVLDIGAWDGYFSFAAEERGAKRVVALDHYVWQFDLLPWKLSADEQRTWLRSKGRDPDLIYQPEELPGIYRPDEMPGMAGFTTSHALRRSSVEPVVADFMEMDLAELGTFDVVLYLGVLYHIKDPFRALRRLREVTRELAIVETSIMAMPRYDDHALWQFFEGRELDRDPTNWWQPNAVGLEAALMGAGFSHVRRQVGPPPMSEIGGNKPQQYRAVVHAYP